MKVRVAAGVATLLLGMGAAVAFLPVPALADDQPFTTLVSTDIQTAGGREFEQWLSWKTGHAGEAFNEFELRSEVEYGITDAIQGSLYLIYDWEHERPHVPLGPVESDSNLAVAGELIFRLLNPYFDPVGLALYVEPTVGTHEREFETRLLLQKNFFNDTLRNVVNINLEDRWQQDPDGDLEEQSALEFSLGTAYNITPELSIGLELNNERGFEGEIIGTGERLVSNSFYLGPTIQYVGTPWTITFGAQSQLPIASNPTHTPGSVVNGFTADDEHFRAVLRLSRDF